MAKQVVVIDVETVPADWWQAPEDKPDSFPPLPAHLPVVLGCWSVFIPTGPGSLVVNDHTASGEPGDRDWERAALVAARDAIKDSNNLVTYNGRGFDMPLLQLRAMACGVRWDMWEARRHRFPNYKTALYHIDLLDQLTDYGAGSRFSLDNLSQMCGASTTAPLEGKGDMHGSKVMATLQEPGGLERIATYCRRDLATTLQIYLRWLFITGASTSEDTARWLGQVPKIGDGK